MKQKLPISPTDHTDGSKSPSISRFITEITQRTVYQKVFWVNFFCGFLVIGISFVGFKSYESYKDLQKARVAREQVVAEVHYWEQVVQKYPQYRDGYFMLATLNAQLGNKQKAREYNQRVLQIDPDFSEGKDFERILE